MNRDPCPMCGKSRGYLMEVHPDSPGLKRLLSGEGEDFLLNVLAWAFALSVVFAVAVGAFALAATIR